MVVGFRGKAVNGSTAASGPDFRFTVRQMRLEDRADAICPDSSAPLPESGTPELL